MVFLSLKVIGYYGHYNFGDEQYKLSIQKLFQEFLNDIHYSIEFIDCDTIGIYDFSDRDIIIIGGGDILNPYFMDKINKVFLKRDNLLIGLSVGLPYTSVLVESSKIQIIDYIFLRTTVDIDIFKRYFHQDKIFYLPDLSYLLSKNYTFTKGLITYQLDQDITNQDITNQDITNQDIKYNHRIFSKTPEFIIYEKRINDAKRSKKKIMGICLSRHFYNRNFPNEYKTIVDTLREFVQEMINENFHIVFIPYNTSSINSNENDIFFANDILNLLYGDEIDSVTNIKITLSHDEMNNIMTCLDLCIPMRFHSVLYCIYNLVPFVSVYSTRKIHNLLIDTEWHFKYRLEVNQKLVPISLDKARLKQQIFDLLKIRQNIYHKLLHININVFGKMFFKNVKKLINILLGKKDKNIKNSLYGINDIIATTYESVEKYTLTQGFDMYTYRNIDDPYIQKIIVSIISYNLIGLIDSEYNYGMQEKIFNKSYDYDYIKEWKWIINDYINKDRRKLLNNPNGFFNMDYIDQIDYSGAHRSGWQYVYEHIEFLHNSESNILLDLYIDRTFHWNRDINKTLNIIPYKNNWIGFIHHTFDTSFSEYNCYNLLNCIEFQESLKTCKALFVLSKYLKQQFEIEFEKMGIQNVKIFNLIHPTETNVKKFKYRNFFNNSDKKLVHVGGWLRNVYSFYNLILPDTTIFKYGLFYGNLSCTLYKNKNDKITKYALRGKNMNNYYPLNNLIENVRSALQTTDLMARNITTLQNISQNNISQNISQNECDDVVLYNNWSKHFYEDLNEKISSVNFIEYLSNEEYDNLITENIVFINLVDASAVNTIIECIVRTTPIIVNYHPAVIELLGEKYPLYFYNNETINVEINKMLKDDKLIRKAHKYLKIMNKKRFGIRYFIQEFEKILIKL
jgi:hypothetical protein